MFSFDIETISGVGPDAIKHLAERKEWTPDKYGALAPPLCRVVCIGASNGTQQALYYDKSILETSAIGLRKSEFGSYQLKPYASETYMLLGFAIRLDKVDRFVTFNGFGFDVPALIHAMRRCGVEVPGVLRHAARKQKPWENEPHIDMMRILSMGGSKLPLEAYAIGGGLRNPKGGGDGGGVVEKIADGHFGEVLDYCHGDVVTLDALYEQWKDMI